MRVLNFSAPRLAFDVGTAITRACSDDSEIVEAPSWIQDEIGGTTLRRRALRGGVVCDVATAAELIAPLVQKLSTRSRRPAALVCTPSDATSVERDRLVEAVTLAGASVTAVVPEPLAAAIGAGVDLSSDYAQLVVDVGEGVTDVALIANGEICRSKAERTGCSNIRQTVMEWLQWHRRVAIDDATADVLIRSFCGTDMQQQFEVRGRDIDSDRNVSHRLDREDVAILVEPVLDGISGFIGRFLRRLPDVWAVEIVDRGIRVTGGGSALDLLMKRIENATGVRAIGAADPLRCVILGAREMLLTGLVPKDFVVTQRPMSAVIY